MAWPSPWTQSRPSLRSRRSPPRPSHFSTISSALKKIFLPRQASSRTCSPSAASWTEP
uniref:RINT1-like protein n=1 Tax=Rhizophora mucronata TaxID=61149 RepID=A0A2P2JQT3_RHIMU